MRNNVFAFGADSVAAHGRADLDHNAFTFERNIFITDGKPILSGGYSALLKWRNIRTDLNLFWDVSGVPLTFKDREGVIGLEDWKALGHDHHSIVADPRCADPKQDDFALAPDSPAIAELGFVPIDLSDVGPRPEKERD